MTSLCRIRTGRLGLNTNHEGYFSGNSGKEISKKANDYCVELRMSGVERCSYDCEYDGFGQ